MIPFEEWIKALRLVRDIDKDDINFVALNNFINQILWTGDTGLYNGSAAAAPILRVAALTTACAPAQKHIFCPPYRFCPQPVGMVEEGKIELYGRSVGLDRYLMREVPGRAGG